MYHDGKMSFWCWHEVTKGTMVHNTECIASLIMIYILEAELVS